MDIKPITRNLSVAIRAERLIVRRQVALSGRRATLGLAALIAGGFGLAALNVAAFLTMAEAGYALSTAALIVAAGDFLLMGLALFLTRARQAEDELDAVRDIRDLAIRDLENEIQAIADGLRPVARDPVGTLTPQLASILAGVLIKALRKR